MQQHTMQHNDQGFSLLELVVAVSIMLILGVVGFVSYQAYTDNARQAALDTSANKVLTAVIAEDNVPDGDVDHAVRNFNQTSDTIMVDIIRANAQGVTVNATTCEGGSSIITAPGNYDHVDTTSYADVQYSWLGTPGASASTKEMCGELVGTNQARDPRAANSQSGWYSNVSAAWTVQRVQIDDHPLGITTAARSQVNEDHEYPAPIVDSLSIYDAGAQPRNTTEFYIGVWVKSDTPGKATVTSKMQPVDVPANEWVFVSSGQHKISVNSTYGYALTSVKVRHDSVETASGATSWATGAVISYDTPVTEYFDGDM